MDMKDPKTSRERMVKTQEESTHRMTETPNPPLSGTSLSGRLAPWTFTARASTWTARLSDRGRPRNPFESDAIDGTLRNLRWTVTSSLKVSVAGIEG